MFKIPPLPLHNVGGITLLDTSFAQCSSTLLRAGRGEKHKIVQITVFPIHFGTDSSLKTEVEKLDIDKLTLPVPVDYFKKTVYDIDTSDFVLKS